MAAVLLHIAFFLQHILLVLLSLQFLETAHGGVNKLSPHCQIHCERAVLILLQVDFFLNFVLLILHCGTLFWFSFYFIDGFFSVSFINSSALDRNFGIPQALFWASGFLHPQTFQVISF